MKPDMLSFCRHIIYPVVKLCDLAVQHIHYLMNGTMAFSITWDFYKLSCLVQGRSPFSVLLLVTPWITETRNCLFAINVLAAIILKVTSIYVVKSFKSTGCTEMLSRAICEFILLIILNSVLYLSIFIVRVIKLSSCQCLDISLHLIQVILSNTFLSCKVFKFTFLGET
jgi:hypothetical protein